ncbi:hypothetical protein OTU49_016748, partial [Cherax quadricarinatus]
PRGAVVVCGRSRRLDAATISARVHKQALALSLSTPDLTTSRNHLCLDLRVQVRCPWRVGAASLGRRTENGGAQCWVVSAPKQRQRPVRAHVCCSLPQLVLILS